MHISTFKFGETPLYIVNGTVTRGILYERKSATEEFAQWVFAASVAIFVLTLAYSNGRSFVARARYALANMRTAAPVVELLDGSVAKSMTVVLPVSRDASEWPVGADLTLTIPKLQMAAPIREVEGVAILGVNEELSRGVVRWPGSARVGEAGAAILLGHSSAPLSYKGDYGSVFALLDKLEAGDKIVIDSLYGSRTYKVTGRIVVNPKTPTGIGQTSNADSEALVLVSCWPVGTDWKRLAVSAERVL